MTPTSTWQSGYITCHSVTMLHFPNLRMPLALQETLLCVALLMAEKATNDTREAHSKRNRPQRPQQQRPTPAKANGQQQHQ